MGMSALNANNGLHIFFLIDCSDNAASEINKVVEAVNSIVPDLQKANSLYPKMRMKARAMRFSTGAYFVSPAAMDIDRFKLSNVFGGGACEMGKAFETLYEQIKLITPEAGGIPPVLVLISNGRPTDDYQKSLTALKSLNSFKKAIRWSFAVGSNPDKQMLLEFTGLQSNVRDLSSIGAIPRAFEPGR
ncbi:MAG: VWA domain-containing protein [Candidatus Bruticola sp.]